MGKKKSSVRAKKTHQAPRPARNKPPFMLVGVAFVLLLLGGLAASKLPALFAASESPTTPVPAIEKNDETPEEALTRIIASGKIINAHEHAQNEGNMEMLGEMMSRMGMQKTALMGSSWFTITMNDRVGFTRYDENNEELLRIAKKWPGKYEAWPTINPLDPDKYGKTVSLLQRGATGVKLYIGHGYVRKDDGNYMFHTIAIDDPSMLPIYEYFEKNNVPICMHVNPYLKGFAEELIAVLTAYPDMKVNLPHFILSSIRDSRLREYFDTFPNVWSDISFGHDDFLIAGIKRISKSPAKFKDLFNRYPERFMFGSDLVLTDYDAKDVDWLSIRVQAYYDMLTKKTYTTPLVPGEQLTGLELTGPLLDNILYRNFEGFMAADPEGTTITRKIDWSRMGTEKTDRHPGQTFPPKRKSKAPATQ